MAIAFDASSGVTYVGTATTGTLSHTCTGSDRILFVGAKGQTANSDIVTGITYAGASMTLIDKQRIPSDRYEYLYYLVAPATGANDIVVTASASMDQAFGGVSYTGASQTSPIDVSGKNTASAATSISVSVTTTTDNCWLVGFFGNDGSAISAGTSTTSRGITTGAGQFGRNMDSNAAKTPTGSYSIAGSSGSANWGAIVAAFKPVGTGPSFTPSPLIYMMQMSGGII